MSGDVNVKLCVYFIDNKYKFCLDGKYVEFKNIISSLKNMSSLMEDCTFKNPLYTFRIEIKDDGSGTSGFSFELKLTFENDEVIHISEPIKIAEIENEDFINVNDKETSCDDILSVLLNLIALTPKIDKEMDLKKEDENLREKVEPKDDRKL